MVLSIVISWFWIDEVDLQNRIPKGVFFIVFILIFTICFEFVFYDFHRSILWWHKVYGRDGTHYVRLSLHVNHALNRRNIIKTDLILSIEIRIYEMPMFLLLLLLSFFLSSNLLVSRRAWPQFLSDSLQIWNIVWV